RAANLQLKRSPVSQAEIRHSPSQLGNLHSNRLRPECALRVEPHSGFSEQIPCTRTLPAVPLRKRSLLQATGGGRHEHPFRLQESQTDEFHLQLPVSRRRP